VKALAMLELPHATTINGNVIRWGNMGEGPPLVAIHGTPFSSQVWRNIVPHLTDHYSVYYFDLAGYGQSEMREGQDVSLGVQNGTLVSLVEEWGLKRPHVLAHDFGGAIALRAYFIDGLRFSSLTIFDAVALAPWGSPFVQHAKQYQAAFAGMPDYLHRALLKAYIQNAAFLPLSDEAMDVHMRPWIGQTGQPAFYRQIAQMDQKFTDEIEPSYTRLDCPVNVLWGERDEWIPSKIGHSLAKLISDRPCVMIEDAGHLVQEDKAEAIISALLDICRTKLER
jgi:pimeloyl-ACP methyl ester carboxylesterase